MNICIFYIVLTHLLVLVFREHRNIYIEVAVPILFLDKRISHALVLFAFRLCHATAGETEGTLEISNRCQATAFTISPGLEGFG